ncbi:MAG: DUF1295 domain-containing protein [Clostridiaceae bacterium]|nr:DUF1295 domain-containing protein [Clostridiaceae bacterium]
MTYKSNRRTSFLIIILSYVSATATGYGVFYILQDYGLIFRVFSADIAATVLIFLIGTLFGNASVYDPYWSVAPIIIASGCCMLFGTLRPEVLPFLGAIWFWGIRLTANWAYTFSGLHRQDWRYDMLKEKSGAWFPAVNFLGIHLFPTLVVFFALVPAITYLENPTIRPITIPALVLCYSAAILQTISDYQMHRFKKTSDRNQIIRTGVWAYSRHPNYLGEILFWWGVFLVMLSVRPDLPYLGIGPVMNTLMFLFISIPMAEKRMAAYKNDFESYRRETRCLFPVPRRRRES